MAKITPDFIDPDAPPRVRGQFLVQRWRDKWVFRRWPQRGGPKNARLRNWRQKQFAIAAQMAANPEPISYWTATEIVKGTQMVPRDFLTACAYARGYVVINALTGEQWPVIDHGPPLTEQQMADEIQTLLDLITNVRGSILYRGQSAWEGLPPGDDGNVLTSNGPGADPQYKPSSGGGGGLSEQWSGNPSGSPHSGAPATTGSLLLPVIDINISELAIPADLIAGGTYYAALYELDGSNKITSILDTTGNVVAGASAFDTLALPFSAPVALTAGGRYAMMFTRSDAFYYTKSGQRYGTTDLVGVPIIPNNQYARMNSTGPAIGNTVDTGNGGYGYLIKWS